MFRTFDPLVASVVAAGAGSSAVIDLRTRRVPNWLTFGLAALGVVLAGVRGHDVGRAIAGIALGLALMLPGHVAGATGAGDVKLLAALGAWLGPAGTAAAFLYSALAGGVLAIVVALGRGRLRATMARAAALAHSGGAVAVEIERASEDNRFAYAPAIAIGALTAALGW
ncbi:MAG: prepilin peptidase [Acidobacteria bacterium]|nr:prepilin peptidase [Acidobacteriota bacterium]